MTDPERADLEALRRRVCNQSGEIQRLYQERRELHAELRNLRCEVECRVEHGAESGGHLEYIHTKLVGLTL